MNGNTAKLIRNAPKQLTSITPLHEDPSPSSIEPQALRARALLINPSIFPNASAAFWASLRH
jgi:hypothetical protein